MLTDAKGAFSQDIILKVRPPQLGSEVDLFKPGSRSAIPRRLPMMGCSDRMSLLRACQQKPARLIKIGLLWCSLISYIQPARNEDLVKALKEKQLTVLGANPCLPADVACCRAKAPCL